MNLDEEPEEEVEEDEVEDEEELDLPAHPFAARQKKRKRPRKNKPGAPKPGLGPTFNRKRRQIQEALDQQMADLEKKRLDAAKQELERLRNRSKNRYATDASRFGTSLVKSVISVQTTLLRVWGHKQSVETKINASGRVIGWTDFSRIRIEWPLDRIPDRMDNDKVLDTIAQIKGVMQHEMGHVRFTTSWATVLKVVQAGNHDAKRMHKCWNMLEDMRMECLVVEVAPRIANYFGTMVANIVFGGNTTIETTWLMLAGREYLPKAVRRKSFQLFDDYCNSLGIVDGGTEWWSLVQDYKAAATEQEIYDAVVAALAFIDRVRAEMPDTVDNMDDMDDSENDGANPADTARDGKGNALDLFDKNAKTKPSKEKGEAGDEAGEPGDQPGDGNGKEGDGEDGDGAGTSDKPGKDKGAKPDQPGQSDHGDGSVTPTIEDFKEEFTDYVDQAKSEMRNEADVRRMAGDASRYVDDAGLPSYPDEGAGMDERRTERAYYRARDIEAALATFITESEPQWEQRTDEGIIDPLAYRTKDAGDNDFHQYYEDKGEDGLDVHVSMLCDVSGSMGYNYGKVKQELPILALSEAVYSCALACKSLRIGSTFTLWSSDSQHYRIWGDGNPTPTIWPTMGGTDPSLALDDLDTHNKEGASSHLVIIFTDGAWSSSFPSLQRWAKEGRTLILVRYGTHDGAVQKDMGADKHIHITDVGQLPGELTGALYDVLNGQGDWT